MKKIFASLVVLSVILAACGGKKTEQGAEATAEGQNAPAAAPVLSDLPAKLSLDAIPLAEVEKMVKVIEADANWSKQIRDKATQNNVPPYIQMQDDARFFLSEHQAEYGIIQIPEDVVQAEIEKIKSDAAWLNTVQQQAKERGITLDESLRKNALYMIDQRLK